MKCNNTLSILIFSLFLIKNTTSFLFPNLLPFYYKIGYLSDLKDKPIKLTIDNNDLVIFKDKKLNKVKIADCRCEHRGFDLSKGKLEESSIKCLYHGLSMCKDPRLTEHIKVIGNDIFFCPTLSVTEPYYPPEHYNTSFRAIEGTQILPVNINVFSENVIDVLHLRMVHTFANKKELPYNLKFERLSNVSYRQSFDYKTGEFSLSNQIQKLKKKEGILKVENEYNLPSNVLSRVNVDENTVKTVFVTSVPINDNETRIFWRLYRNFMIYDYEMLNVLADKLFRELFEFTLDEDKSILKKVIYSKEHTKKQFHTKYDRIQREFRHDCDIYENYIERENKSM